MNYTGEDIKRIRKELKISQEDFASKLEITRQWLIKIEKGAEKMGPHQIALLEKYFVTKRNDTLHEPQTQYGRIPFYDVEASAGNDVVDMMPVSKPTSTIDVGDFLRDSECAIRVYGNSMLPNYPSGCVVGLRLIKDGVVEFGNVYVLETDDNRYLKRIIKDEENKGYILYSDNTMKFADGPLKDTFCYQPFHVPYTKIIRMYRVVGMIKRNENSYIFGSQKK